ncbi:MAG: TIGR00341 family protein [Thermoanaerobaculia bacterium]|nr:TIGR00341 family protein [Thermoanaerobaculia bacterium]
MSLRLIQVTLPADREVSAELGELAEEVTILGVWDDLRDESLKIVQFAVETDASEELMDRLEDRFGSADGFRLSLLPLEASLPRLGDDEDSAEDDEEESSGGSGRISREELYEDVGGGLGLSRTYLALAGLSTVVAGVGLLRGDLAVVIGAMVIAPLLRPNIALALAATLGDGELALRSLKTNAGGLAISFPLALALGWLVEVDPAVSTLASRTSIDLGDLALALAAGAAGTLAFTRGLSSAVIGVMVAVALLPPLVVGGILLGAGHLRGATGALLLTAGNVVCVNLSAVATFWLQRVRPRRWWEAERARRSTLVAAAVWILLLVTLVLIVYLGGEFSLETAP